MAHQYGGYLPESPSGALARTGSDVAWRAQKTLWHAIRARSVAGDRQGRAVNSVLRCGQQTRAGPRGEARLPEVEVEAITRSEEA
ncbi:MAG: hypothetical protein ABSA21_00830 [Candidatus Limnocylindrales bacterium]